MNMNMYDRNGNALPDNWYENEPQAGTQTDRRVAQTIVNGDYVVSTVWLCLDHSHGDGPPIIFESMVFGPDPIAGENLDRRYSTEEEALRGHLEIVDQLRST